VKKKAMTLTPEAIEKHNAAMRGYNHDDETRTKKSWAGAELPMMPRVRQTR
jgi:hypothetical protein